MPGALIHRSRRAGIEMRAAGVRRSRNAHHWGDMNITSLLMRRPLLYLRAWRYAKVARYLVRRAHEPEFEMFRYLGHQPGRVFLDIGANTGQSAMSFRIYDARTRIVSLEPNPALAPELEFVGSSSATSTSTPSGPAPNRGSRRCTCPWSTTSASTPRT